jgi:hypothetical protein
MAEQKEIGGVPRFLDRVEIPGASGSRAEVWATSGRLPSGYDKWTELPTLGGSKSDLT